MEHNFFRDQGSNERGRLELDATITIGASGAPTLTRGRFITSISRTSTGLYVLTLAGPFARFLNLHGVFLVASGVPAANMGLSLVSAVTTTGVITFKTLAADNSATPVAVVADPASGEVLHLTVVIGNSGT